MVSQGLTLTTARLHLRPWREDDLAPFAALNADPEVMRHFPAALSRAESDEFVAYVSAEMARNGWGLWAVEVAGGAPFIGMVGLNRPRFQAPFMPVIEVGWRLARPYWGFGYATEAAAAALALAFDRLDLPQVVAFTATVNQRSIAVMRRLGMSHDPAEDFDHPNVPEGPLRRHVLYRMTRERWRA